MSSFDYLRKYMQPNAQAPGEQNALTAAPTESGVATSAVNENTVQDVNSLTDSDLLGHYGVGETNRYGYSQLVQQMNTDKLDTNKRYAVQQAWFDSAQKRIDNMVDPYAKEGYQQQLDALRQDERTFRENTVTNFAKEAAGRGKDQLDVRVGYALGRVADTASGLLEGKTPLDRVKDKDPALYDLYVKAAAKKQQFENALQYGANYLADPSNPLHKQYFNEDGTPKTYEDVLTEEEREALVKVPQMSDNLQDERVLTAKDGVTGYFGGVIRDNMRELAKKSNIAGYDDFARAMAESGGGEAFSSWGSFGRTIATALESTVSQAPELVAGAVAGMLTGGTAGYMAYQTIASSANVSIEAVQNMMDTVKQKYEEANPGKSLANLSDEEFIQVLKQYSSDGTIDRAMEEGAKSGAATSVGEAIAGGVTGKIGFTLSKFGLKPANLKKTIGKAAVAAGVGVETISECIEESAGQIASNLQKGADWSAGVSESCVRGLLSIENGFQTVAATQAARSEVKEATQAAETQAEETQAEETTTTDTPAAASSEEQQASTEPAETTDDTQSDSTPAQQAMEQVVSTEAQVASDEAQPFVARRPAENTPVPDEKQALFQEFTALEQQAQDPQSDKNVIAERQAAIRAQFVTETPLADGTIETQNTFDSEYNRWALDQARGRQDESRAINRDGSQDDNGAADQSGADGVDIGGERVRREVSERVSPDETQTSTSGHRESDTGLTPNLTQPPNDNAAASNPARTDGRTGETDGRRVEQGEPRQERSGEDRESTPTSQPGNSDGGVRERAQSTGVGETLAPRVNNVTAYRGGQTEGRALAWYSSNEHTAATYDKEGKTTTRQITMHNPRTFDAQGQLFSQIKPELTYTPNTVAKQQPAIYDKVIKAMYGEDGHKIARGNLIKKSDRLVFDTLAHNAMVENGLVEGTKYDGVTIDNVIDIGARSSARAKVRTKEEHSGTDYIPFGEMDLKVAPEQLRPVATEAVEAEPKPVDRLTRETERKNRVTRTIDEAAIASTEANPYSARLRGKDLRNKQKAVRQLLDNPATDEAQLRAAFLESGERAESFEVAKRGYVRYTDRNPTHKEKAKNLDTDQLLGFDFDGNPVFETEEAAYAALQQSVDLSDIAAQILTEVTMPEEFNAPKVSKQVAKRVIDTFSKTEQRQIREEAAEFHLDDDGNQITTEALTDEQLAEVAVHGMDEIRRSGSKLLRNFFRKLYKVLASVMAIVAIGTMVVPNDAMAQQGFAQFTQGEQIRGISVDASNTVNWVVANKDHRGKNFVVMDKENGVLHVVSPEGKVLNTQNALFGKNKGNEIGLGNTPSGRFLLSKTDTKTLTAADRKAFGDSVLDLTDPKTGRAVTSKEGLIVAMHRVMNTPQRKSALQTANASDNYLTNGCINVPTAFYNTAVDKLDGAMVYVLDQAPKQAKKAQTKVAAKPAASLLTSADWTKPVRTKWSVKPAEDIKLVNPNLDQGKVYDTLRHALGELADDVVLITKEEFGKHKGYEQLKSNGVEGFYDPRTERVAIVVDNIEAQNGLSANERLAWVAWHELYHKGLDVKYKQDLDSVVENLGTNPFVAQLAQAIAIDREANDLVQVTDAEATQEALVELGAALATGKLDALQKRYGVNIPSALRGGVRGAVAKFVEQIRRIVAKVIGRSLVTTKQVTELLADSIAYAKTTPADKAMAKTILDDLHNPDSALAGAVLFSVSDTTKKMFDDVRWLYSGDDVGRTGTTPDAPVNKSMKARTTRMNLRSRFWTWIQDSQQVILDMDPEGEGGALSRSVASYSNRKNQLVRKWDGMLKELEYDFIEFAEKSKDVFKTRFDRKMVDDTVQATTTALHAITDGNKQIRKNIEETIFGKEVVTADGEVINFPGLLDKLAEQKAYLESYSKLGLQAPTYLVKTIQKNQQQLNDMLAIQDKFDQDNYNVLSNTSEANKNREHWHGFDGYTFAEAEARLAELHKLGLLDSDVVSGLERVPYKVRKYVEVNNQPQVIEVTHYAYRVNDVAEKAKGRIMPLVDKYTALSKRLHRFTADQLGDVRAGGRNVGRWEVSTMGKVENVYSQRAMDQQGNPIDRLYMASESSNIDNIISMKHAAQYDGRRHGRGFHGGTALEQLGWRLSLTAQQVASKDIAKAMYELHDKRPDLVRVYTQDEAEYSLVSGILHEVPFGDNNDSRTRLVKVSFADQEANRALFGENLPTQRDGAWGIIRGLTHVVSAWAKFNSASLTQTLGFGFANAYKGFNEKLNQLLAWTPDHAFVKSIEDPEKRALFDGTGTKIFMMAQANKVNPKNAPRLLAREKAAVMFALDMAESAPSKALKKLVKKVPVGLEPMVREEYMKLQEIYEAGGLSSKVEDLMHDVRSKKHRFARGKTSVKITDGLADVVEATTVATMSQELVSSLIMVDFLANDLGMDRKVAIDANLHFMNFNKRGAGELANYLRKYTMFANAVAQGSRAFERSFIEQTNNPNDSVLGVTGVKWSKPALWRTARNVAVGLSLNLLARAIADQVCPDQAGLGNQVGNLNNYQLLREIPISIGCNEYYRHPVEYGVGMMENALAVGMVQVATGDWSIGQAFDLLEDAVLDNASPVSMAVGESDGVFGKVAFALYPFVPDLLKDWTLAFGGVDQFGNPLNSTFVNRDYRPGSGKSTTDDRWGEIAETMYKGMGLNITPEEAKVLITGPFRGVAQDLFVYAIEKNPKKDPIDVLFGTGSLYRDAKELDTVAYTMVMNRLNNRYSDLNRIYNLAQGRDKVLPSEPWLKANGYDLDDDSKKALDLITTYRERMKNKRLAQETRFNYNVELLKGLKQLEGSN